MPGFPQLRQSVSGRADTPTMRCSRHRRESHKRTNDRVPNQSRMSIKLASTTSFTLAHRPTPSYRRALNVKFLSNKDLSWPAFGGALVLTFIVVNAFRGPLPGGAFSERAPVLAEYLGNFIASFCFGAALVLVVWLIRRIMKKPYTTPRRDLAIATLLMMLITFKTSNAAALDMPLPGTTSTATHLVV